LSVSTSTGKITGTPTAAAKTSITISATNAGGNRFSDTHAHCCVVEAGYHQCDYGNWSGGRGISYQIAASNTPTSYSATGLPAGLSVSTSTGKITGMPTTAATSERDDWRDQCVGIWDRDTGIDDQSSDSSDHQRNNREWSDWHGLQLSNCLQATVLPVLTPPDCPQA